MFFMDFKVKRKMHELHVEEAAGNWLPNLYLHIPPLSYTIVGQERSMNNFFEQSCVYGIF